MVWPIIKLFLFQILRLLKNWIGSYNFSKKRTVVDKVVVLHVCLSKSNQVIFVSDTLILKRIYVFYCLPPVKLYFRPDHSDLAEPSSFHIRQVSAGAELFLLIPKYDKPLCNGALICVWINSRQVIAGVELFWIIQNFDSLEKFNVTGLQIILYVQWTLFMCVWYSKQDNLGWINV